MPTVTASGLKKIGEANKTDRPALAHDYAGNVDTAGKLYILLNLAMDSGDIKTIMGATAVLNSGHEVLKSVVNHCSRKKEKTQIERLLAAITNAESECQVALIALGGNWLRGAVWEISAKQFYKAIHQMDFGKQQSAVETAMAAFCERYSRYLAEWGN